MSSAGPTSSPKNGNPNSLLAQSLSKTLAPPKDNISPVGKVIVIDTKNTPSTLEKTPEDQTEALLKIKGSIAEFCIDLAKNKEKKYLQTFLYGKNETDKNGFIKKLDTIKTADELSSLLKESQKILAGSSGRSREVTEKFSLWEIQISQLVPEKHALSLTST